MEMVSFYTIVFDWEHINLQQKLLIDFITTRGIPFALCLNRADTLYSDVAKRYTSTQQRAQKIQQVFEEKMAKFGYGALSNKNCFLTCFDPR